MADKIEKSGGDIISMGGYPFYMKQPTEVMEYVCHAKVLLTEQIDFERLKFIA